MSIGMQNIQQTTNPEKVNYINQRITICNLGDLKRSVIKEVVYGNKSNKVTVHPSQHRNYHITIRKKILKIAPEAENNQRQNVSD